MKKSILFIVLLFAFAALFSIEEFTTNTPISDGAALLQSSPNFNTVRDQFKPVPDVITHEFLAFNQSTLPVSMTAQKTAKNDGTVQYRGGNAGYYSIPVILICVLIVVLLVR